MFKSALYPAVITFKKKPDENALKEELESRKREAATRTDKNNSKLAKLLGNDEGSSSFGGGAPTASRRSSRPCSTRLRRCRRRTWEAGRRLCLRSIR